MTKPSVLFPTAFLAAGLLLSASCSSAVVQANRYFSLGDYPHAAAAYEASLGDAPTARTLYRLGIARATPGTPAFDAAKAAEAFDALSRRYPSTSYARQAALPAALLKELTAASDKLAGLRHDLDQAKSRMDAAAARSQQEGKALKDELEERQSQVLQLKSRVAEQEETITRMKTQMDQIKRIDLGGSPR